MSISRVGVDIAKSVFHVHGVDRHDQVQWRGKYQRDKWLDAIVKRVPAGAEIGMEAKPWVTQEVGISSRCGRICCAAQHSVGFSSSDSKVPRGS